VSLIHAFAQLDSASSEYASRFVDLLLHAALAARASDVHLQPRQQGLEIHWRLDGVLHRVGLFPRGTTTDIITRLKVLAELLTYRNDVPQEGRLRNTFEQVELRVSTFPTLHGERAAIRIFTTAGEFRLPSDLGLPGEIHTQLQGTLTGTSGAVIVAGPAGSGKTTTVYACLRAITAAESGPRSVITLEDPIESELPGVAQSQIAPAAGFDLAVGLRSLLRQDPEVLLVGEIRDALTAEGVFQAALTGHLVFSTFHAGSAAEGLGRLREMGIEPYLLHSGLQLLLCQRLLRRLCSCARPLTADDPLPQWLNDHYASASHEAIRLPQGCAACSQTGYLGRLLIAEMLSRGDDTLRGEVYHQTDTRSLHTAALSAGMISLAARGRAAVLAGDTTPAEVQRVLGRNLSVVELEPWE
jgi:type II secretory ATPase GspE/PulE/Tfp pilus assembly ATPase PilB-like protein